MRLSFRQSVLLIKSRVFRRHDTSNLQLCTCLATHSLIRDPLLQAINDACLVFDERLVIDHNFRTNDVCVRAAGPLTKFARRYHADDWTHAVFNSKEIGVELANGMLNVFDDAIVAGAAAGGGGGGGGDVGGGSKSDGNSKELNLIPLYNMARIQVSFMWVCTVRALGKSEAESDLHFVIHIFFLSRSSMIKTLKTIKPLEDQKKLLLNSFYVLDPISFPFSFFP